MTIREIDQADAAARQLRFKIRGGTAAGGAVVAGQGARVPAPGTSLSPSIVSGLIAVSDVVTLVASGLFIFVLRYGWQAETLDMYVAMLALNAILMLTAFHIAGLYRFDALTERRKTLPRVVLGCALAFLCLAALAYTFKISATYSRVWAFSWLGATTILICAERALYTSLLCNSGRNGKLTHNVAIVGAGEQCRRLISHLQGSGDPWQRLFGIFDDRTSRVPKEIGSVPHLGDLDRLVEFARQHRVDEIIVTLPWNAESRLAKIIERLTELPVHIRLSSDLIGFAYPNARVSLVSGIAMLEVARKPIANWQRVGKQLEDWLVAAALAVFAAPLMLIVGMVIKLDSPGPIFFRQKRYGYNNQAIHVYKFRTMFHDRPPDVGSAQARKGDPRVTRVGRFLRLTSIDELPQLLNVLNGSMSLVGPRPLPISLVEEHAPFISGYHARHKIKPGITGWAQVNGLRGETEVPGKMLARVEHDIYYIENWSLLFDLQILFMTLKVIFGQQNAY